MSGGFSLLCLAATATAMRLLLYDNAGRSRAERNHRLRSRDRTAGATSGASSSPASAPGSSTTSKPTDRTTPQRGMWFNGQARLVDPWAKVAGGRDSTAGDRRHRSPAEVRRGRRSLRLARRPPPASRPLRVDHLRDARQGFYLQSDSSGVDAPGTYLGRHREDPLFTKVLGVTAVELMPVHDFAETGIPTGYPKPERRNYWGYDSYRLFSPAPSRLSRRATSLAQVVHEFKEMVRALTSGRASK